MSLKFWDSLKYNHYGWALVRASSLKIEKFTEDLSPDFENILKYSNYEFYTRVKNGEFHGSQKEIFIAYLKYHSRCTFNPIPRKLYAGYATAPIKNDWNLEFSEMSDWQYRQVSVLRAKTNKFYFNPHIYFSQDEIRWKTCDSNGIWSESFLSINLKEKSLIKNWMNYFSKPFSKNDLIKYASKKQVLEKFVAFRKLQIILPFESSEVVTAYSAPMAQINKVNLNDSNQFDWELNLAFKTQPGIAVKFVQKLASATSDVVRIIQNEFLTEQRYSSLYKLMREQSGSLAFTEIPVLKFLDKMNVKHYQSSGPSKNRYRSVALSEMRDKILSAVFKKELIVTFSKKDVDALVTQSLNEFKGRSETPLFPVSLSVFCEVGPDNTPILRRINGGSFYTAMGRYASYDDWLSQYCQKAIDSQNSEVLLAVIDCDTQSNGYNLLLHSSLLNLHRICINKACTGPLDIPLSDLVIKAKKDEILLRSIKHRKQIVILNSSMVATDMMNDPALDLLTSLGHFSSFRSFSPFSLDLLRYGFKPRIVFPSAILSLACWRISANDQNKFKYPSVISILDYFSSIGAPSVFNVVDTTNDSRLRIDLNNSQGLELFQSLCSGTKDMTIEEILLNSELAGADRSFNLVIPLYMANNKQKSGFLPTELSRPVDLENTSHFLQKENGVLSFEIMVSKTKEEQFIFENLLSYIKKFSKKNKAVRFFFVRQVNPEKGYSVRVRFVSESKSKLNQIQNHFLMMLADLRIGSKIESYALTPFEVEFSRYGEGPMFDLFLTDSDFQSRIIFKQRQQNRLNNKSEKLDFSAQVSLQYLKILKKSPAEMKEILAKNLRFEPSGPAAKRDDCNFDNFPSTLATLVNKHTKFLMSNYDRLIPEDPTFREEIVFSFIHMLNNRLGISIELEYFLLRQLLKKC